MKQKQTKQNKELNSTSKISKLDKNNHLENSDKAIKPSTKDNQNKNSQLTNNLPKLLADNYPFKKWTINDLGTIRNDLLIAHYDDNKKDLNTPQHIIWANGNEVHFKKAVDFNAIEIKSRVEKDNAEQANRSKDNAEVYTPFWICNLQNDLVDQDWFKNNTFIANLPIKFKTIAKNKQWHDYVLLNRMEITCGEAPYLASRYDVTKGTNLIDPTSRTGLLDRKIRVINTFATSQNKKLTYDAWHQYVIQAYQSIYGFEYQGDSLFLARCNLLLTYIDYYQAYFQKDFDLTNQDQVNKLKEIANIICWNIWQMDGITNTTPNKEVNHKKATKNELLTNQTQLEFNFSDKDANKQATINTKNNNCLIFDWKENKPIKFITIL